MIAYKKIKALGTEIEFYLQSDLDLDLEADLVKLELIVNNFENKFSRFVPNSELSLLNKIVGDFKASPELIKILLLAKKYYKLTSGIFDPTILRALEGTGYNKSFDLGDFNEVQNQSNKIDFSQIIIDENNNTVKRLDDLKIDFGGIGKGYLVDALVTKLKKKGYKNFWISAGGDMYLSGLTQESKHHQVGVQNPLDLDNDLFNLTTNGGELAIATSGIAKRQWLIGEKKFNHLIDPRNGQPVDNGLLSVTVASDSVVKSDIFAKTVLILGKEAGLDFINQQDKAEALIISENLELSLSQNMGKYLIKI